MHAAIKVLEETLLIRRLQARELAGGHDNDARLAALREDIAGLERGLKILMDAERRTPDDGPAKTAISGRQQPVPEQDN